MKASELRLHTARVIAGSAAEQATGTAFFVMPGTLLTCSHVVSDSQGVLFPEIRVRWSEAAVDAPVKVIAYRADEAKDSRFPFPDLALLAVDVNANPAFKPHPCVPLNVDVEPGDEAYVYGYSGLNYHGEPIPLNIDGKFPVTGIGKDDEAIKLSGGLVLSGISGAPVLNKRTGGVCGIVKRTRSDTLDLGGYAVSAKTILDCFPQLQTAASASPAPGLDVMLASFQEPPLSPADKDAFVHALLKCSKLQSASGRSQLVNELPDEIKLDVEEKSKPVDHVLAIVNACLDRATGLSALFDRLAFFESGKTAHDQLLATVQTIYVSRGNAN